jgi:hypothetical protein
MSSDLKKAYTNEEVCEILDNHFEAYVCSGILKQVDEDGVYNDTFLAHNGNHSSLYGLSAQATISIQKKIDNIPWASEDDNER